MTSQHTRNDAEALKQAGVALFGGDWKAPLARELDVNVRRIRDWLAGRTEIPEGVWRDIVSLLETRQLLVNEATTLAVQCLHESNKVTGDNRA